MTILPWAHRVRRRSRCTTKEAFTIELHSRFNMHSLLRPYRNYLYLIYAWVWSLLDHNDKGLAKLFGNSWVIQIWTFYLPLTYIHNVTYLSTKVCPITNETLIFRYNLTCNWTLLIWHMLLPWFWTFKCQMGFVNKFLEDPVDNGRHWAEYINCCCRDLKLDLTPASKYQILWHNHIAVP